MKIVLPYKNESDIKRAEWIVDELYSGNEKVTVDINALGDEVTITAENDTRVKTRHFESVR